MKIRGRAFRPYGNRRIVWLLPTFVIISTLYFQVSDRGLERNDKYQGEYAVRPGQRQVLQTDSRAVIPDCIPAAINDFPNDFFTQEQRAQGGVVLHFLITFYLCGILAYVCDDYFVPSLEILSDYLKVPTDVAGATFMAIGTSAPELFSSVIGSFITEGDIGVGTIVGSAVFNILGVTSVAGLAVWKNDVPIDWYPISRDCLMYAFTVIALIGVISNNIVTWYESLILLLMFGFYIFLMFFNSRIEEFSTLGVRKLKAKWDDYDKKKGIKLTTNESSPLLPNQISPEILDSSQMNKTELTSESGFSADLTRPRLDSKIISDTVTKMEEDDEDTSLWSMPDHDSMKQITWVLFWPTNLLLFLTVPDCRKPHLRKLFPVTFVLSVIWIGGISYLAVWMVTIIGYTLAIPDTVSGITILAAGTSVPEVISSVIVAKSGLGNMAICNLLGSNIFDILFCLGAPWLIKTALSPEGFLIINSSALTYTSITLLSTVVMLFVTLFVTNWQLNYKVGFICLTLYIAFITLACMYELNVFGDFNPPPCPR